MSLSPLLGLWALSAQIAADPGRQISQAAQHRLSADALPNLFHPVVSLLILAAGHDANAAARANHSIHDALSFDALRQTSYRGSLWMVRSEPSIDLFARSHPPVSLRC